jgi:RNA polymerase sigma factor (sigma-70 family)
MTPRDPHRAVEAVWRIEAPRLIGALMRIVRDRDLAEEFAQDALVSALEQWPQTGVPDNPGAWLMTAARHRAIDRLRRHALMQRKHAELLHELEDGDADASARHEAALDDAIGDDLLRLIFTACHPVLSPEARAALTLRLLGGLTTEEIARAYLAPEPTVAQRIVRAKRTLAEAGVPYALQAAIAACHARAASTETTDWTRIAALYDALAQALPSPVVELNRAPSPTRWRSDRTRGWRGWTRCATCRRCGITTCCRACAAICCSASAVAPRRAPSSNARRRWPATRANASCCCAAPPPATRRHARTTTPEPAFHLACKPALARSAFAERLRPRSLR